MNSQQAGPRSERYLDALGVSAAAEGAYAALVRGERLGVDSTPQVSELVRARLAHLTEDGAVPLPVRLAVEAWATEQEAAVTRARLGADHFAAL